MSKTTETTTTKLYMHKDATEGNAFVLKMKAIAFASGNDEVKTMVKHNFDPMKVADTGGAGRVFWRRARTVTTLW
jgi:hypothetical protein